MNPLAAPVCAAGAVYDEEGGGRVAVLGSVQLLDDSWLDKEDNSRLADFLFKWLRPVSDAQAGVEGAQQGPQQHAHAGHTHA